MTLRRKIAVALAIVALQAVVLLVVLRVERDREHVEPAFAVERVAPREAPDLAWSTIDGSKGRLLDARGTVVVLHFWATWCPPCVTELPGLLALGRELERDGTARVIAVSVDDDWAAVGDFFAGDIPPEVVRAPSSAVAQAYGVSTLPETYVVAADGVVHLRVAGERDWRTSEARAAVRRVIEGR